MKGMKQNISAMKQNIDRGKKPWTNEVLTLAKYGKIVLDSRKIEIEIEIYFFKIK